MAIKPLVPNYRFNSFFIRFEKKERKLGTFRKEFNFLIYLKLFQLNFLIEFSFRVGEIEAEKEMYFRLIKGINFMFLKIKVYQKHHFQIFILETCVFSCNILEWKTPR
jgi:hypothetical protein